MPGTLIIKGARHAWNVDHIGIFLNFSLKKYLEYRKLMQLDLSSFFLIKFKVEKTFNKKGLERAIYEAVSSNGINIKSKSSPCIIEFSILVKEFSVASVQFLILKSLIFVNMIVRRSQNYQAVKLSSYF